METFFKEKWFFCILWTFSGTIICRQVAEKAIRAEVREDRLLAFQDELEI